MANYEQLRNDYPELAAMFQALEGGMYDSEPPEGDQTFWAAGYDLRRAVSWASGGKESIAAGLRMVADAIDPPEIVVAMREVAETLAGPKVVVGEMPGPCTICDSLTHITIAHPSRQT